MIARELLVKLGFDIDENKLNRFTGNIETLKSRMAGLKDKSNLEHLTPNLGSIDKVRQQMSDLKAQIDQQLHPQINHQELTAYREELRNLSKSERLEIQQLNKLENEHTRQQINDNRLRYKQLQQVKNKLLETKRGFSSATRAARAANMTFSRYFTRFALIGSGSFMLSLRKTLKDAQDFRDGGFSKTDSIFTRRQLIAVDRFNMSLRQTKKALGDLRNGFIIDLLPAFREYLDLFNIWLAKNKKAITSKINKFIETLGNTLTNLSSIISTVIGALNPLIDLIGGWGVVVSGIIGLGILSWVVRLGVFLNRAAAAVTVFAGAIKVLTVALMTNPIYLLLTAIAGVLVLVADEFIVTSKGGDSLMNRFAGLKRMGDAFIDTLQSIWGWLVKVKDNMFDFTFNGGAVNMFSSIVSDAKGAAKDVADSFDNMFSSIFGNSKDSSDFPKTNITTRQVMQRTLVPNIDYPNTSNSNINEYGNSGLNILQATSQRHNLALQAAANRSSNNKQSNTTKNVTINQTPSVHITVNAANNTEEQAIDIADEVRRQIQSEIDYSNEKLLNAIGAV